MPDIIFSYRHNNCLLNISAVKQFALFETFSFFMVAYEVDINMLFEKTTNCRNNSQSITEFVKEMPNSIVTLFNYYYVLDLY